MQVTRIGLKKWQENIGPRPLEDSCDSGRLPLHPYLAHASLRPAGAGGRRRDVGHPHPLTLPHPLPWAHSPIAGAEETGEGIHTVPPPLTKAEGGPPLPLRKPLLPQLRGKTNHELLHCPSRPSLSARAGARRTLWRRTVTRPRHRSRCSDVPPPSPARTSTKRARDPAPNPDDAPAPARTTLPTLALADEGRVIDARAGAGSDDGCGCLPRGGTLGKVPIPTPMRVCTRSIMPAQTLMCMSIAGNGRRGRDADEMVMSGAGVGD
ncbi:hypothetical protein B0H11DRAFT_1931484 [Mycena galericulata]|nr:hypothetical protein B0H11DRAFT_1931484 [Mycena galericulata]